MFAAIITRASRTNPLELATGEALLEALFPFAQPDVSGTWSNDCALIALGVIHNTSESLHECTPEVCLETGRVIASWARLDNRSELCAMLGIEPRAELTDPQLILAAHRHWGRDCTTNLDGDFSFVIHDPSTGETFCGRDAVGTRPFYYVATDEVFIAATSIAAIKAVRRLSLTPNLKWTALFAAGMNFAHDQSAYEEVRKLPPAHDMVVSRDGDPSLREYFTFDLHAPGATTRDQKWVNQYREAFDHAVAVRSRSEFPISADNSGGLDSASVIASMVRALPRGGEGLHTFALLSMEREPELVDAVSKMCGVAHTHTLVKPEMMRIDASFDRALTALGHPPEHGQTLIYPEFFGLCQRYGIRTILSGYGGDEVVTSYANALMDELHHRREYRTMFAEMPGSIVRRTGRFAKRMWRGPDDPDVRARALMDAKLAVSCLKRDFLEDTGLARQIEDWFIPARSEFTLNAIAASEPGFRLARAARLESTAIFASTHAVEYRFPMFDRSLMQQFFATPSIEKRHQSMGRYLHRRAMEGRIPPAIQWQASKDVGGFIDGKPVHETPEALTYSELPDILRQLTDETAFEKAIAAHQAGAAAPSDGFMRRGFYIWQIRQLSAWLGK